MEKAKEKQKERNERGGEKMKNNCKRKYQKGITLIALVITIIVLLILAAVSIATLTGENGILSKANTAKEETQREDAKEQAKLDIAAYVTDDLANGGDGSITNQTIKEILTGKDYVKDGKPGDESFESTTGQTIKYSELYGDTGELPSTADTKPYLPSEEFSKKEGDLKTGLVIEDGSGNSYVWIEVPTSIYKNTEYTTNVDNGATTPAGSTDYTNIEKVLQNYAKDYRENGYSDEWYSEEQHGLTSEKYTELKNKMLKSVYENGGFWIGQYEVGYEKGVGQDYRYYVEDYYTEHPANEMPVCKEGAYPYNWVTCSQAEEKAESMNSGSYESSLMFGIQWDLVMKHIETKNENGKTYDELKSNSTTWGNYKNATFTVTKGKYSTNDGASFTDAPYTKPESTKVLLTTGASERNSVLNIYDIAGNVYEWTLEQYTADSSYPCCVRGGYYISYGGIPASDHGYYSTSDNRSSVGFRSALYK